MRSLRQKMQEYGEPLAVKENGKIKLTNVGNLYKKTIKRIAKKMSKRTNVEINIIFDDKKMLNMYFAIFPFGDEFFSGYVGILYDCSTGKIYSAVSLVNDCEEYENFDIAENIIMQRIIKQTTVEKISLSECNVSYLTEALEWLIYGGKKCK